MVENFFRPEELNACRDAIKVLVDDLAKKLHDAGKITSKEKHDTSYEPMCCYDL